MNNDKRHAPIPLQHFLGSMVPIAFIILLLSHSLSSLDSIPASCCKTAQDIVETKYLLTKAYLVAQENRGEAAVDFDRAVPLLDMALDKISNISLPESGLPSLANVQHTCAGHNAEANGVICELMQILFPTSNFQVPYGESLDLKLQSSIFSAKTQLTGINRLASGVIFAGSSDYFDHEQRQKFIKKYNDTIRSLNVAEYLTHDLKSSLLNQAIKFKLILTLSSILMSLLVMILFTRFERRRAGVLLDPAFGRNELPEANARSFPYEHAPAMMHAIDSSGTLLAVSKLWLETLGYTKEEVIGRKYTDFISGESKRTVAAAVAGDSWSADQCKNIELQYIKKNGEVVDVLQSGVVESDATGNAAGSLAVLHDVSELHRVQHELLQSHKMEAMGTMAGGIAHDFNNILTIIIGNVQMATRGNAGRDRTRHAFEQILKASNRAKDLVKQILAFSRQSDQEFVRVRPCEIIGESQTLLRAITPASIEIITECEDECLCVLLDPTQFHQILMNLCANAVHAMDGKGTLTLAGSMTFHEEGCSSGLRNCESGNYFKLTVSDTGAGIDRSIQHRIFDPFFTTKDAGEGTGMGLPIVKRIVQSHGGYITMESETGKGTAFHLYFPAYEFAADLEEERGIEEFPRGTEKVLLVDDEVSLAELGRLMLGDLGYEVTVKTCSLDALETFRADPHGYDLVITDQTMPYLTGTELAQQLLKENPAIPIILCTGYSQKITEKQVLGMGVRKYFLKPVDIALLVRTVRELLDEAKNPRVH